MTTNRRKKNMKQRGHHTHGWGHKKKHRGAGNRGGRGMAGSGKRADHKKISILQKYGTKYFGKYGFKIKDKKELKTINIYEINKSGQDILDLKNYKVLGTGDINRKVKVIADKFSKKALEKIKKAGGEGIVRGENNELDK